MTLGVSVTKNEAFKWQESYQSRRYLTKGEYKFKTQLLSGHSNWRRLTGLPIAACNLCVPVAITVISVAEHLLKGLVNVGVGIATLNGKTALKGIKQLGIATLEIVSIPFEIVRSVLGLIILPPLVLIAPDDMYTRYMKDLAELNAVS